MRVAFLTNQTAQVSLPVLQELIGSPDLMLVHTFFYDTFSESRHAPREIFRQYGVQGVLAKLWRALGGRLRILLGKRLSIGKFRPRTCYELAVIDRLPYSLVSDMNAAEIIDRLEEMQIDVLLVCVCKNILRHRLLALRGVHFINIHPSLLPQYQGPAPTFWTLYYGESRTGVTFHRMTPKIDQGPILRQLSVPLDPCKSEQQIELNLFTLAASVVKQVLRDAAAGRSAEASQSRPLEPSYYSFPTPAQRRELRRRLAGR